MGFFSDLFGGGSKDVTQTATQQTTVNTQVDVQNEIAISTEEIAKVLEKFGLKVTGLTEQTQSLIAGLLLTEAAQVQQEAAKTELVRKRTKQAGILGMGAFLLWWLFKKQRKK